MRMPNFSEPLSASRKSDCSDQRRLKSPIRDLFCRKVGVRAEYYRTPHNVSLGRRCSLTESDVQTAVLVRASSGNHSVDHQGDRMPCEAGFFICNTGGLRSSMRESIGSSARR